MSEREKFPCPGKNSLIRRIKEGPHLGSFPEPKIPSMAPRIISWEIFKGLKPPLEWPSLKERKRGSIGLPNIRFPPLAKPWVKKFFWKEKNGPFFPNWGEPKEPLIPSPVPKFLPELANKGIICPNLRRKNSGKPLQPLAPGQLGKQKKVPQRGTRGKEFFPVKKFPFKGAPKFWAVKP